MIMMMMISCTGSNSGSSIYSAYLKKIESNIIYICVKK